MKIIIIGGGLSGLTTAGLLSKKGHQVTLVEKNNTLGGRARVLKTMGFVFDMGPSWYMMPEVIEKIFNDLGTETSKHFELVELKNKYRVFSDTRKPLNIVSDIKKNLESFEKISPAVSPQLLKIFNKTRVAYDITVAQFLNKPYNKLSDFLNLKSMFYGLRLLILYNPFQSYHNFVKKHVSDPFIQKILEFHTVFLGGNPYMTPALYSILISADFDKKIWYPMGGMGMLINSLEKICKKNKVEILTNHPVEKILVNGQGIATGVSINNKGIRKKIETDLIISTVDYAFTELNLIPKKFQSYSEKYWQKQDLSISSLLIYLGIDKKLKNLQHHNFYFQENWDDHFDTINKTDNFPSNPCFYVSAPSITDSTVAPANHENLFILVPLGTKTKTDKIDIYADEVLKHVENKIGEKFVNNIIYKKIYSNNDFEKDYNAFQGNALGLSHTLKQSVFLRPSMKSKKIKNLYFGGQFTQPGVGVPMVMLSAQYLSKIDLLRK